METSELSIRKDKFYLLFIGIISIVIVIAVALLLLVPRSHSAGNPEDSPLPLLNAILNGTSAVLLSVGYFFIRNKKITAHKTCMLFAFGVSSVFLVTYVIYHYYYGSKPFEGSRWIRPVYFSILISHILLAVSVVPLALIAIFRGLKGEFSRHKKITRWALPIWLYVSVTGVLVYILLYQIH